MAGDNGQVLISIHALREEGDSSLFMGGTASAKFQSTPSARRATYCIILPDIEDLFQSTPSARRATFFPDFWRF